jgi:hypothetical protein
MPKYKYKQKLKEYIARHGKPDALTEYFILQGFSEDEIKEGWSRILRNGKKPSIGLEETMDRNMIGICGNAAHCMRY